MVKELSMPTFDVILVPGGGVNDDGELPIWTKRRLDRAIAVNTGEYILTLSAGTVHKPPVLDKEGYPIFESVAAANYLVGKGIPARRVLTETCSYDTIGNAYFSRVTHVEPGHFKRLMVITSEFHMPRTKSIFEWVYSLDVPPDFFDICFESVTDEGIDKGILEARREKEKTSLASFVEIRNRTRTLQELHEWLFTGHGAYSISARPKRLTGEVLKTY
jgi:hypothetical protein